MNTIILPGYFVKNKDWAEDVKRTLEPSVPINIHYWSHWTNENEGDWKKTEIEKLLQNDSGKQINVIAKSIGTLVAMQAIGMELRVKKLILCGVPLTDLSPSDEKEYEVLKKFSKETALVIQNEKDPHGSFNSVKELIFSINSNIEVVSKPADNHKYYYAEDFLNFLQ